MFIFKKIVVKLWMTIIALVIVVLLILGLFLFQYIDSSFPKSNVQSSSFTELAESVAVQANRHMNEPSFVAEMNALLSPQNTGLITIALSSYDTNVNPSLFPDNTNQIHLKDVFTQDELAAVFHGQTMQHRYHNYLFAAVPVTTGMTSDQHISKILILHQSVNTVEDTRYYVKRLFALVSLIGFLLTTFFAFFLITKITKPLQQLKKAADLITKGEYGSRVPIVSSDEIGELAKTFNLMGERLETMIEDLYDEKENLSSVLRGIADAVISFDVSGKVIFTNPHGEELLDKWHDIQWYQPEPEDSDHKSNEWFNQRIPQPLQPLFSQVIKEDKEMTTKLHVLDGVWSVAMAPLYSQQMVRGAVAVLREVTEEHLLEKLRKDFVANVSHELRTPLSLLQGYSEALLDDIAASAEARKELAQVIHDESLRMGRLVNDLLDLARMDTGYVELNFNDVNLNKLLKRVHRKFHALCKENGLKLELTLPESEIVLTHADEDRLEQVLTNLLDNAIRHTANGAKIMMRLELQTKQAERVVLLEVEDQGQGISPQDLKFIFDRFYKADKARKRGAKAGTGLGLAIAKNIIVAHQGQIHVHSTLGKGTTFSIVFPIHD